MYLCMLYMKEREQEKKKKRKRHFFFFNVQHIIISKVLIVQH